MGLHKIKKGLNLPINGEPDQTNIEENRSIRRAAFWVRTTSACGRRCMWPKATVWRAGNLFSRTRRRRVSGSLLRPPGKSWPSTAVKNARSNHLLLSFRSRNAVVAPGDEVAFSSHTGKHPNELSGDDVKALLLESGLWTALRARPYSRVADPEAKPQSIFVTAMDSHPLAPSLDKVLEGHHADFERGLAAVSKLTDGSVYVCTAPNSTIPVPGGGKFEHEEFGDRTPLERLGFISIASTRRFGSGRVVPGRPDVVAIGKLFETGKLYVERVVSLAGPRSSDHD